MSSEENMESEESGELLYEFSGIIKAGLFLVALTIMMIPVYIMINITGLGETILYGVIAAYLFLTSLIIYKLLINSVEALDFSTVTPLDPSLILKLGFISLIASGVTTLLPVFGPGLTSVSEFLTRVLLVVFIVSIIYLLLTLYLSFRTSALLLSMIVSTATIYGLLQLPVPQRYIVLFIPFAMLCIGTHSSISRMKKGLGVEEEIVKPEYETFSKVKLGVLRLLRMGFLRLRRAFALFLLDFVLIVLIIAYLYYNVLINPGSMGGFIINLTGSSSSNILGGFDFFHLSIFLIIYLVYLLALLGNLIPGANMIAEYEEELKPVVKSLTLTGILSVVLGAGGYALLIVLSAASSAGKLENLSLGGSLTMLLMVLGLLPLAVLILVVLTYLFMGSFLSKLGEIYGSGSLSAAGTLNFFAIMFGVILPIAITLLTIVLALFRAMNPMILRLLGYAYAVIPYLSIIAVLLLPVAWGLAFKGCSEVLEVIEKKITEVKTTPSEF